MAFDFYFAGTQCKEADDVICRLNANVLKSYVNDKKNIKEWFERKKNGWKGKLMIDNGEFTFHRKGGTLDIDEYIQWLNDNDEYIDYAIALDNIPGKWGQPRTSEDVRVSAEKTYNNYLYMVEHMKSPKKALPVFHMGESFDNLKRFLAISDLKYMCLSGMKDLTNKQREDWYDKCFETVRTYGRDDIRFHCLGSATPQNAIRFDFQSMDATSWIMTGASGSILTDKGAVYIGKGVRLSDTERKSIADIIDSYNLDMTVDDVINDYKPRMILNVMYLFNMSNNIQYNSSTIIKRRLF